MRKKRTERQTGGNPSKQDRECLSEGGERKICLGRKREERSKQGRKMLAEMEKEVMVVSFLFCEPEITWLEFRQ